MLNISLYIVYTEQIIMFLRSYAGIARGPLFLEDCMAIDRETLELRKREIDLYRHYQNTLEYRQCRETGGRVFACFKLLIMSIVRELQLKLGNRYRKYAGTITLKKKIPHGIRSN